MKGSATSSPDLRGFILHNTGDCRPTSLPVMGLCNLWGGLGVGVVVEVLVVVVVVVVVVIISGVVAVGVVCCWW